MFDALVITKSEKTGLRTIASLPAAATAHFALLAAFYLYALYAPAGITSPPAFLRFDAMPALAIPVMVVHREDMGQARQTGSRPQLPSPELRAPAATPEGVKPAGQSTAQTEGAGAVDEGFAPVDTLKRSDAFMDVPKPAAVQEYQLSRAVEVVSEVQPEYPAALRAMSVAGRAVVKVTIGAAGQVEDAEVVSATHPLFGESALTAVKQWRFTRSVDQTGATVRVIKFITVNFAMKNR